MQQSNTTIDKEITDSLLLTADLLDIDPTHADIDRMVNIFSKKTYHLDLQNMANDHKKPPGLKGLELASTIMRILIDVKEHETLPVYDGSDIVDHAPRAIKFIAPDIKNSGFDAERQTEFMDTILARHQYRAFRMGLYILGKNSPAIEYLDSAISRQPSIVAISEESNRSIIGQKITENTKPALLTGSYGAHMTGYVTNAFAVYPSAKAQEIVENHNPYY